MATPGTTRLPKPVRPGKRVLKHKCRQKRNWCDSHSTETLAVCRKRTGLPEPRKNCLHPTGPAPRLHGPREPQEVAGAWAVGIEIWGSDRKDLFNAFCAPESGGWRGEARGKNDVLQVDWLCHLFPGAQRQSRGKKNLHAALVRRNALARASLVIDFVLFRSLRRLYWKDCGRRGACMKPCAGMANDKCHLFFWSVAGCKNGAVGLFTDNQSRCRSNCATSSALSNANQWWHEGRK